MMPHVAPYKHTAGKPHRGFRLASTLVAVAAVGALWTTLLLSDAAMAGVQRAFAVVTSAILGVLGRETEVHGASVVSEQFGISVVTACTGWFATGLYVLAVLVYPATWRARLVGCVAGAAALFAVNVVRLVSLYYVGVYWPGSLDVIHQVVWQSLVIAVVVAMWLLWAGQASSERRRRRAP